MAKEKEATPAGVRAVRGLLLVALCLFLGLSLFSYDWQDIGLLHAPPNSPPHNMIGPVGAWISFVLLTCAGLAAYVVPVLCLVIGAMLLMDMQGHIWRKALWMLLLLFALGALMELHSNVWLSACQSLNLSDAGGVLCGIVTRDVLIRWLSPVGTGIVLWLALLTSVIMVAGPANVVRVTVITWTGMQSLQRRFAREGESRGTALRPVEHDEKQVEKKRRRLERIEEREAKQLAAKEARARAALAKEEAVRAKAAEAPAPEPMPEPEPPAPVAVEEPTPKKTRRSLLPRKKAEPKADTAATDAATAEGEDASLLGGGAAPAPSGDGFQLPPMALLNEPPASKAGGRPDIEGVSTLLVETLGQFGIEVEVTNVEVGPVVTSYELRPAPGVRVERISGLANNIALALKATSIRVQAPIPGKGAIGIEIPNKTSSMVVIRDVLESDAMRNKKRFLPLVLGKDVGGKDLIADLAEMPHLLVAGATGAGKTVCMNTILAGLLMTRTPDELRLVLVDPKIVEFSGYNRLPHLVVPVVTDPKKVALALRWAINEMEKRYKLFAKAGVRNIASFNSRVIAKQEDLFGEAEEPEKKDNLPDKVPYIVIVIDELADLMLADGAEIENCVARLAQLSRAVGIHMILSTQRPSVNVITGTIKANFPARIAFQVAQKVDSRTILDAVGADKLLGKGDLLFMPPGSSKLVRAQGAMTTDQEIRDIVEFLKKQGEPAYEGAITQKLESKTVGKLEHGEEDELMGQAVEIIRETRRASTSSLQRRLRIGYTRAARLMDILEERGIVGPPRGSDPREILIDLDGQIPDNTESPEESGE